jgi:hypothetical protein
MGRNARRCSALQGPPVACRGLRDIIVEPPGRAHHPIDELPTFRLGTKEFLSQSLCALLFPLLFRKPVPLLQLFDAGPDSFQFSQSPNRHITIPPIDKPGRITHDIR